MSEKIQMQWTPVVEMALALFTILGATIPLYLHTDGKIEVMHQTMESIHQTMESNRQETNQIIRSIHEEVKGIQQEMKDFHGRLERQDAEFKAHMAHHHKE